MSPALTRHPALSIIVPVFNEAESLPLTVAAIFQELGADTDFLELVLVDDGSRDQSWNVIDKLCSTNRNIKAIKFRRNYGKSAGLNEGFKIARQRLAGCAPHPAIRNTRMEQDHTGARASDIRHKPGSAN